MNDVHKELLLIDARNLVYRHAWTRKGLSSKGRPTGAIFGVLSGLIRLNRLFPGASMVFCWDGERTDLSWRNVLAKNYKGHRRDSVADKTSESFKEKQKIRGQIPIVMQFLQKMGFKNYSVPKLEADDLIGILATSLADKYDTVTIYSMDKDFTQLMKGNIQIVNDLDKKNPCSPLNTKTFKKRWGILPKHWLHYRSLVGEKTDHIDKPIEGVGPKKAIAMLKAGVDPSSHEPHPDYKKHWSKVRLCYKLTKIVRRIEDSKLPEITKDALRIIVKDAETHNLHRSHKSRTKQTYAYMMRFLVYYELSDIIERRDLLWRIP